MSRKDSTQDSDGLIWVTTSLPLGTGGLDLRRANEPSTMTKLRNARFLDSKTMTRRDGHTERLIQDYSAFQGSVNKVGWVYGHGTQIELPGQGEWQSEHYPIHIRGGGTFSLNDVDVVWTGDRLLVVTEDGSFRGGSTHWARSGDEFPDNYGCPAYLPVQTDTFPPITLTGNLVDTCLTDRFRVVVRTTVDDTIEATVITRDTGMVVSTEEIDDGSGDVVAIRAINSGNVPCVVFLNGGGLQFTYWNGDEWQALSVVEASAISFDTAQVTGGFHLAWVAPPEDVAGIISVGKFVGSNSVDSPYPFGMVVDIADGSAAGQVGISVSRAGDVVLVWEDNGAVESDLEGLNSLGFGYQMDVPDPTVYHITDTFGFGKGVTVSFRGLTNSDGRYPYIVHASDTTTTYIWEISQPGISLSGSTLWQSEILFNACLCSKSFLVGDEVFAWLTSTNSLTNFLAAGVYKPQICGIADRETAIVRTDAVSGTQYWLACVSPDPLVEAGTQLTWLRPYNAGTYFHPGNCRIGDINFLPSLSAAKFGKSAYLAGSHVRNWDGIELGDAGWHDYPKFDAEPSMGGALTAGFYGVRVYAVRYNHLGERFMSVAATERVELTTENEMTVTIKTIPVTNHDDAVFEVYRSEVDLTTFYLEGVVANDRDVESVVFTCAMADATLTAQPADSHAPGIGVISELEEFGPLGCEILVTGGDRMWGIGGQVERGLAQYSKLWEPGEGVGFDALAGTQVIDATGGTMTSLAAFGDSAVVVFQKECFYALTGSGPDNYGVGSFSTPQLVIADGATCHAGTISLPVGVGFWGAGGPRLINPNFQVANISEEIVPLTSLMTPTGARAHNSRGEVVWYTAEGRAVLWNYIGGKSRWAEWTGLPIAGCSQERLVTTDGRLLQQASTPTDGGRRFVFEFATGNIRLEQMLLQGTKVRRVGMVGEHKGPHKVRFKVYYDGSKMWSERFKWEPTTDTWLKLGSDFDTMTPAEMDALENVDHSGTYGTHMRLARQECRYFQISLSDGGEEGFIPWELVFEIGQKPGLGRTPVNTFA